MKALVCLAALLAGCARRAPPPDPMVHAIALPEVAPPDLPDAPGRAEFVGACTTCHTSRYVSGQPPFPRRVWKAEVDKMRLAYRAPFPDSMTDAIVNYLVAVRGTGE